MILREIMQVYDSSLLEDETPEQRAQGFKDVLEAAVKPMLDMCSTMGNLMKTEPGKEDDTKWQRAIFLTNCLVYIEVRLSLPLKLVYANSLL
jgi:hypothetical protein